MDIIIIKISINSKKVWPSLLRELEDVGKILGILNDTFNSYVSNSNTVKG